MTNQPTTTLAKLRSHNPCADGWAKLLKTLGPDYGDDTPITLLQILDSNGLDDALWALRACDADKFSRLLACDYAERVLHIYEARYPKYKRPRQAIEVSRRYTHGEATDDELDAAGAAARAAARAAGAAAGYAAGAAARAAGAAARAAGYAAGDAARAAGYAAGDAARAAAWDAENQWQEQHLRGLLND